MKKWNTNERHKKTIKKTCKGRSKKNWNTFMASDVLDSQNDIEKTLKPSSDKTKHDEIKQKTLHPEK